MKKNTISIILFILCFSMFIILRIFADNGPTKANAISNVDSASKVSTSDNISESSNANTPDSSTISVESQPTSAPVKENSSDVSTSPDSESSTHTDTQNKLGFFSKISSSFASAWTNTITYISDSISSIKEAVNIEESADTANSNKSLNKEDQAPSIDSSSIAVDNSITETISGKHKDTDSSTFSTNKDISSSVSALDASKSTQNDSAKIDEEIEDTDEIENDSDFQGFLDDIWHGDFTPQKTFKGDLPRIICWGDSLTETLDNKTAYPDVLHTLTDCEVINYGVVQKPPK